MNFIQNKNNFWFGGEEEDHIKLVFDQFNSICELCPYEYIGKLKRTVIKQQSESITTITEVTTYPSIFAQPIWKGSHLEIFTNLYFCTEWDKDGVPFINKKISEKEKEDLLEMVNTKFEPQISYLYCFPIFLKSKKKYFTSSKSLEVMYSGVLSECFSTAGKQIKIRKDTIKLKMKEERLKLKTSSKVARINTSKLLKFDSTKNLLTCSRSGNDTPPTPYPVVTDNIFLIDSTTENTKPSPLIQTIPEDISPINDLSSQFTFEESEHAILIPNVNCMNDIICQTEPESSKNKLSLLEEIMTPATNLCFFGSFDSENDTTSDTSEESDSDEYESESEESEDDEDESDDDEDSDESDDEINKPKLREVTVSNKFIECSENKYHLTKMEREAPHNVNDSQI